MKTDIEITDILNNDLSVYERFFHQYYTPLVNYANTIVKDMNEAEDIVQQSFVNLWEKKEGITIHTSLRGFMYKAVYNASLNNVKHKKVRLDYAQGIGSINESINAESIDKEILEKRIDAALEKLPDRCAEIFKLSRFEELSYKEIAEKLQISIKTVENQMGKALKIMRFELQDYLGFIFFILTLQCYAS